MIVIDFYTRRILGPKDIAARAEYQPQSVAADWPLVDDRNDPDEIVFDHKRMDDIFGPETKPRDNSADHDVAEYAEWISRSAKQRHSNEQSDQIRN